MGAVRVIILDTNRRILLGFDSKTKEYSLPGGQIEEGETPENAAIREVKEETGIFGCPTKYCFEYLNNKVYLIISDKHAALPLSPSDDPDLEFLVLHWYSLKSLPHNVSELAQDIIYRFFSFEPIFNPVDIYEKPGVTVGKIDVFVDDEKVYDLDDGMIWETLPRLAQEQTKGKRVRFKQQPEEEND